MLTLDSLTQPLDIEDDRIDDARKTLRAKGIYGKVSATSFDGQHLPYIGPILMSYKP
jgi:hypothetical protein